MAAISTIEQFTLLLSPAYFSGISWSPMRSDYIIHIHVTERGSTYSL